MIIIKLTNKESSHFLSYTPSLISTSQRKRNVQ